MNQASALAGQALAFHDAGICVIPAAGDRPGANDTKQPWPGGASWTRYQAARPSRNQVASWFSGGGYDGFGLVCGTVSGGLEMLEFEGRAIKGGLLAAFGGALADHGLGELWKRVVNGYMEATPSGGMHTFYRIAGAARKNTKLARRPATEGELTAKPEDKLKVLIETRGEHGFVVAAPSGGSTHPTGKPWQLGRGGPASIATITEDERDALYAVASLFDQVPPPIHQPSGDTGASAGQEGRPGDDYSARKSWEDILAPHGWQHVRSFGGGAAGWRRPGKNRGISATTRDNGGLYVFSTSTPFETETPYTKFGAYALLEHGGDHHAAARALAAEGYGKPAAASSRPAHAAAQVAEAAGPSVYGLDDDSLALRLADAWHQDIRYCPQRRHWLTWDGNRWRWDDPGKVHELARGVARALPEDDPRSRSHRRHALSGPGLRYMIQIASTDPRLTVGLGQLDADPFTLNTPAGPVDLRTGKLLPPDPARLCARSTAVTPAFGGQPELWLRFLADTFAGDPALTSYVQRLLGLSLAGAVIEQLLPFCYGEGQNGKSTLLDVVQKLAGTGPGGYAAAIPVSVLLSARAEHHPTEIAQLAGVRLAVTSEPENGQRFAEARVKLLTGGDQISARYMHGDFFTFAPTHTIWVAGNHRPEVRTGGPAFWRRLRLIPFLHRVPDGQRIKDLDRRLTESEGPQILAWLIAGAAAYFASGITEPESVQTATHDYEASQDTVGKFIGECCATGPASQQGMAVKGPAIFAAYESWCHSEGDEPLSRKAFFTTLAGPRFGVARDRDETARWYRGVRLLTEGETPAQDHDRFSGDLSGPSGQPDIWGQNR